MSTVVAIEERQAERLRQLALEKGTSQSALIEAALDMLFLQMDRNAILQEDAEYLRELDQKLGILPPACTKTLRDPNDFTVTHSVYLDPQKVRRPDDTV